MTDKITGFDLALLDKNRLLMTRAYNPPNKDAKYSVWDENGRRGYGATLQDAIRDWAK